MKIILSALTFALAVICTSTLASSDSSRPPAGTSGALEVAFDFFTYSGRDPVTNVLPAGHYRNPILSGFYPDPSICKAGADYYLVNSTFAYYPGLPIFHSKDLVSWELIGHAINRPDQLRYDGLKVSEGIFAPAISYHEGTFYLICTMVGSDGNFVLTATNPAGPWSNPQSLKFYGIDPSLFFDEDGRTWIVNNDDPEGKPLYDGHRAIRLREFDPKGMRIIGESKVLVNGGVDISTKPIWIEGPHLYKRDGWYYLSAAEGGTGPGHSQVVFRSRKVDGPYEPWDKNPILTQRDLDPAAPGAVTCTGHSDIIEGPDGHDWVVFLGVRPYERDFSPMGRETFLLPVDWPKGGWPMILSPKERVPLAFKSPGSVTAKPTLVMPGSGGEFSWRDEFSSSELSPLWIMLRSPKEQWWTLDSAAGRISLCAQVEQLSGKGNPSYLGRRVQHQNFTAATLVHVPKQVGVTAGLAVFQNERYHYFMGVRKNGEQTEVFVECANGSGATKVLGAALLESAASMQLRVVASAAKCTFEYSASEGNWKKLVADADAKMLTSAVAGGFVGVTVGMHVRCAPEALQADGPQAWRSDNGDGNFTNPPLYADYPDPDIIRVGEDFYFATTTFVNSPGLRILHSQDLINWEIVSHVIPRLDGREQYDMKNGTAYRSGVFAPSLRYHNGMFYVVVTPVGQNTRIYSSKTARGPWQYRELNRAAFDPGMFIEPDGKGYIATSGGWDGTITLLTLNADYSQVVSDQKIHYIKGAEGSKLVKRGDWYYLFNAIPARLGLTCSRATNLSGPWETIEQIDDRTGGHQGAIVDLPDGSDYGFVMKDCGAIGRMTYLSPIFWTNGWPNWGTPAAPGRVPETAKKPIEGKPVRQPAASDDFDKATLGLQWQWNHNPDDSRWSLTERPGFLRLKPTQATNFWTAQNTITQKGLGTKSRGEVKFDLRNLKPGDVCGFGTLGKFNGHIAANCGEDGEISLSMQMIEDAGATQTRVAALPIKTGDLFLCTDLDFERNRGLCSYSLDGNQWKSLGGEFDLAYDWRTGTFQGQQFAVFCFNPNSIPSDGFADLDYFRLISDSKPAITVSSTDNRESGSSQN